jgi:hypothetical protein
MTANTSQEKKKEVAKEKRVQDHGRSIIEVKKSFRYLHTWKGIQCHEIFSMRLYKAS